MFAMAENLFSQNSSSNGSARHDHAWCCEGKAEGILLWAVLTVLFSVLGCPACLAVLWELLQRHRAGTSFTPNDIFMLNLTSMDLVFLSFMPFGCFNYFVWRNGSFMIFTDYLSSLNMAGRPMVTACICLDCYVAVVHPIFYRARKSLTPRLFICAFVWTVTFIQGSMAIFVNEFFHSPWAMTVYAIALPVITACNIFILRALKSQFPGNTKTDVHPKKRKAMQVITNSMVMTGVAYVPPVLGYMFGGIFLKDETDYECFMAMPILIAPAAGSAIMPLLYLGNLGKLGWLCNN